ncbi:esterase [Nocardiopsis changdeensis]|uniref:Esterase n=1 Tax=Nocardiopsis changdeensis TaxID=2831969 RepID=A0ABX8BMH2_9ACTN|nr:MULTISPECIES: esterase [Nocardiopsis]QUX23371.1 esterase [Nocardiopsis changdeensis]QYX39313.1 esterase [Nocardiopsis sp. MT53]
MFSTFSQRAFVLVSSGLVAAAAAALAALPPEGLVERVGAHLGPDPALAGSALLPPREGGLPAPLPRPGQVSACVQSAPAEVVTIPDETAPAGERELWIRRPVGPDSADLPVLYLLHGAGTDHRGAVDGDARAALDREMCRTGVEFVVAVPERTDGAPTVLTRAAVRAVEGAHERPRTLRAVGGADDAAPAAAASRQVSQAVLWNPAGGEVAEPVATRLLLVGGGTGPLADSLAERGMTVATHTPDADHSGRRAADPWGTALPGTVDFLVSGWTTTP